MPRQFVPVHHRKRNTAIGVIVLLVLFIFIFPLTRTAVRRTFGGVGTGTLRATHGVAGWVASLGANFRSKQALEKENTRLKDQISELDSRLVERDTLARENADLKAVLGRTDGAHFTLAAILAKPPVSLYDTLVIDGGAAAGLSAGEVVYANGEAPIGVITEALPHTALVKLYSAPGEKTEARLSPSNLDIELVGRGGGNFSATIPHDVAVDATATAVGKDIHPHILALFKKITSDSRDPFQTLLFEAPVNVMHLSFVEVKQN